MVETRLFFGKDRTKPVIVATDIQEYLDQSRRHHYKDKYSMAEASKAWVAADGCLPKSIAKIVGTSALDRAHSPTRRSDDSGRDRTTRISWPAVVAE
jgi:hypothetical protein